MHREFKMAEEECSRTSWKTVRWEITRDSFSVKRFLKDHMPMLPPRVVVNKIGTWQRVISAFLQRCLLSVQINSPIVLKKSEELIDCLQAFYRKSSDVMSMDIKNLYYLLRQPLLLARVRDWLEANLVKKKINDVQPKPACLFTSFIIIAIFPLKFHPGKTHKNECKLRNNETIAFVK